jgi:hypothetical protein
MGRQLFCNSVPWTETEKGVMRASYLKVGMKAMLKRLPGRSRSSILSKAYSMGLKKRRHWTDKEASWLRSNWGVEPMDTLCARLRRSRASVHWKAEKIGLKVGAPEGWETITAAARRSGYAVSSLRNILAWADAKIILAYHATRQTKCRRMIVESFDVDDAVERWLASEYLHSAAKARRMGDRTLLQMMLACGGKMTRMKKAKGHGWWRAETREWDRAVMEARGWVARRAA